MGFSPVYLCLCRNSKVRLPFNFNDHHKGDGEAGYWQGYGANTPLDFQGQSCYHQTMKVNHLVGLTITECRHMTVKEMDAEDWQGDPPIVLVLSDGTKLYPGQDTEGNSPGAMFEMDNKGRTFRLG